MRVVIDALQAGNRSGTGRYIEELVPALAALDADLELHVVGLGTGTSESSRRACSRSPLSKTYALHVTLPRLARRCSADLVHFTANVGALRMPRNAILTVHDLSFLHHPEWFSGSRAWYYRAAVPHSARTARRVIAVSRFTAGELQTWLGLPASRIDVVHNGISSRFQPAPPDARGLIRNTHRLPERFFLYVGTLEPRKNVPRLIAAWSLIARETECDLVIAGREGWKTGPVRDAAEASPLRERIHFPGYIADEHLPALLSAATAFVWPSLFEGFGWPPLEAMACGTPVVTSNASSLPEIVEDAALTVDPYDTEALADAMRRIVADEALRGVLRGKGRDRAATFSWERAARETLAAYSRAMP